MMQENPKSEQGAVARFVFNDRELLVTVIDGEPWFNANTVCSILEYGNPRQALDSHVEGDDVQKLDAIDSLGRAQLTNHINEPGLYALILGSEKPEAKAFKRWVTHEVLPSIRKTGGYTAPRAKKADHPSVVALRLTPAAVRAARALGLDKNAAAISADQAVRKITGASPMGLLGVTHLVAENQVLYFTPTELGQRMGVSGQRMNILLAGAGLQERKGRDWVPTSAADGLYRVLDTGKVSGGAMVQQVKWCARVLDVIDAAAA